MIIIKTADKKVEQMSLHNVYVIDNRSTRLSSFKKILNNKSTEYEYKGSAESTFKPESRSIVRPCNENCIDCNKNIVFLPLEKPFILFIHTSNKCFCRYVKQFFANDNNCWIVCYSGDDTADSYEALREKHPSKKNIKFFPHISPSISSEALNHKWDIKAFIEAVITSRPNPFDCLERKGTPYLIALSILCQGYLVDNFYQLNNGAKEDLKHLNEISAKVTVKGLSLQKDWWKPALDNDFMVTELIKELGMVNENDRDDNDRIDGLVTALINCDNFAIDEKKEYSLKKEKISDFTNDKVLPAYKAVSEILKSK